MQIIDRHFLGRIPGTLRSPAIISSLLVLPLMILELKNRHGYGTGFPIPLFVILWLLPFSFIVIARPIASKLHLARAGVAKPLRLLLGVASLIFIAWFWATLVLDQMPCFLGVPNCD